jgi:hypothetical protein
MPRGPEGYVNPVAGAGAAGNYNAPLAPRGPAAPAEAGPGEAAAPPRPATGWAGVRAAVKPAGQGPAQILPGREGPIKMLDWSQYWLEAIDPAHRPGHDLEREFKRWETSGWDLSFWDFLDTYGMTNTRKVDYIDQQSERQKYMLLAKDGKLWQERKEYSTLTAYAPFGGASGWAIFVVSAAGVFYGAEAREGKFHHSTIMAGAAVRAAGEIRVEGGKLIGITPYSGHYRPGSDHLLYALQQLESRGVDSGGAAVAHVTDAGRTCTWFEAKDYIAHGENGTPIARPAGHTKGKAA